MKLALSVLLALAISVSGVQAQTKSYTGIRTVTLQNVSPIIDNNVVTGYSLFYFLDKVNSKENMFSLSILDNNLIETHSVEIIRPKNSTLIESSFNGERFCFSFYDLNKKTVEYLILNKKGEEVGSYKVLKVKTMELRTLYARNEGGNFPALAAIPGKGFIRYGIDRKTKKGGKTEMVMFDNEGKEEWTAYSGSPKEMKWEGAFPMLGGKDMIVTLFMVKEKLMSQKYDTYILFTDANTGMEITRINSTDEKYVRSPIGVSYDPIKNEYFVYGEYFNPKDNIVKDKSQGFYFSSYDNKGVLQKESYASWTNHISKVITMSKTGKFDHNTNVTIHKMIRTADGKIFAIGEQFKKVVSGGAVAANVLIAATGGSSNLSNVKIELHDMMVFEFDADLKVKKVHIVEKDKTNIMLQKGYEFFSTSFLAFILKYTDAFNYAFTTISPDGKTFNSAYVNYDRDKETGKNYLIGNIAYSKDQKIAVDKIKLTTKPTVFMALPAKPGYITIFEYTKKAKTIDFRLEKLNL